jgi:predicted nucleic acid-binding protein
VPFVVDASVALSWLLEDEPSAYSEWTMDQLRTQQATAPAIWPLEVANALRNAEQRGRITTTKLLQISTAAQSLPVTIIQHDIDDVLGPMLSLAQSEGISVYDASYMHLALQRQWPLATLDTRLSEAASKAGLLLTAS